jgi:DNA-binding SARP family transcriptional activator/tetratricopeptide (TPR) repeat protein
MGVKAVAYPLTIVLQARLLGALEVELNGTAIDSPATQRPWTVFAYLALADRPVSRAELANTFWPDGRDQSARASLRSALWSLRRQIGDALVVDGERVELRELAWVDIRDGDPLELCRGELLEGLEDEWALQARERHRERVVELLEERAQAAEPQEAIRLTRLQSDRAPFDEQAHRRLMERLAAAGDRAAAIRVYAALVERLRRELGVAPSPATRELADRLRAEAPARKTAPEPPPGLLPLVGRDHEIAALERQWGAAADGRGSVAVVRGEAGIGKTRLATELRLRAERFGARTAACAALDLGGTAPFSLWAELIRELLPTLSAPSADTAWPDDLAVLVSELPGHFGRSGIPSTAVTLDLQRTRLFEAVIALVGWAARDAPLLLVFEDVKDADAPSLELVGYAARRLRALPVMFVITRRELPVSADADRLENALRARGLLGCELSLGPLAPEAVAALARQAARLGEADVTHVVERAEGNALLAVETARTIREQVAPSLRGSVRATLSPLSGDIRSLLEIVAVAARPLELAEVEQLELQDAAAEALQTGLLGSADGRIAFRHALLREAAYEEIAEPRRRSLHRRWAHVLLDARPDEAARHLRLAGADLEAVPQLALAAAAARAVAALEQAAAYLREALEIAPSDTALWLELAEIEAWRGRREQAEEGFGRALTLLEDADELTLARAWLRLARANHGPICVPRVVLDSARKALDLLGHVDQPVAEERSEALAACAWAEAVAGSVDEAEKLLVELEATPRTDDDLRTYDAGHARALALMRRGRFVESFGPSLAAGEAIMRAGRPDLAYGCWANAASAAAAAGEWHRALEFVDRGTVGPPRAALQSIEIQMFGARAFVLRGLGRLAEARVATESQRKLAEQLGEPSMLAIASHDRGLVELEAGAYDLAAELLSASLIDDALISAPLTRLALAEALARSGQPDAAEAQVRATVLEPLRPSDFPDALVPRLARAQGLIAHARGDLDAARRRLEEAVGGWERLLKRTVRAESITAVLADLGRPVVGLIEPERELARAGGDLEAIESNR